MQIRGIHIRGKNALKDVSLEFMDNESRILQQCLIQGSNASGKTFIFEAIARGWSSSVLERGSTDSGLMAEMIRVDYEVPGEIVSVHIRSGRLERSSTLAKHSEVSVTESGGRVRHGIVFYDLKRLRLVEQSVDGGSSLSSGVQSVLPILHDLHVRDISDSVVMIDSWDFGLDSSNAAEFYKHLVRHTHSKNNQLLLSSVVSRDYIPARNIIKLDGGCSVISEALALLGKVRG